MQRRTHDEGGYPRKAMMGLVVELCAAMAAMLVWGLSAGIL